MGPHESGVETPDRLIVLEVARGVAMLAVFLFHALGAAYGMDDLHWDGLFRDWSSAPSPSFWLLYPMTFGWVGVPLFFVLSGFVIHRATMTSGRPFDTGRFLKRRFWRIYPPYLLALVVFAIATHASLKQFAAHALLLHNFRDATFLGICGAFWSLAVEAQFYLAYPIVLMLRRRMGMGGVLWLSLATAAVSLAIAAGLDHRDWSSPSLWYSTPATWWTWVLGAYTAERHSKGERLTRHTLPVAGALALLLVASTLYKPTFCAFRFGIASALAAVLLDAAVRQPNIAPSRASVGRLLAWLGVISYSCYLWHQPIIHYVFERIGPRDGAARLAIGLPLGILVAVTFGGILYRCVEKPSAAIGRARGRTVAAASASREAMVP